MIDPDAVVAAVERLPVVERLSGGEFGEVATYLPGRRVRGVRARDDHVEVHVVLRWQPDLVGAAAEVRRAVRTLADGMDVDVFVTDVVTEDDVRDADDPEDP